jgi:hypothetical protein
MRQTADIWRWADEQVDPGPDLSSATDCKSEQCAADDQHNDHDQNEFTDTGDKTSGLKLGGEQGDLGRSEGHDYQW